MIFPFDSPLLGVSAGLCRRLWLSSDGSDRSGRGDADGEVKSPPAGLFRAWGLRCRVEGWRFEVRVVVRGWQSPKTHSQIQSMQMGVSQNCGEIFLGPSNKDHHILGSILGSPYFWKLPNQGASGDVGQAKMCLPLPCAERPP